MGGKFRSPTSEHPPEEIKERKILCLISLTPDIPSAANPQSCLNYLLFLGGPFCLCLNISKTVFLSRLRREKTGEEEEEK